MADAGFRLLFKFRSGTHGLNEELGRHRGREGNKECVLCVNECESASHVLWECSAYSNSRVDFFLKLQEMLGNGFERFDALDSLGRSSFNLGRELWEEHFDSLLPLLRITLSATGRIKLYSDDSSQSQSSTGDLGEFTGQSGKNMCQGGKPDTGKFHSSYIGMNVCGSAVVDGTCAAAAD